MNPLKSIDQLLNGITMYRLMVYVLIILLLVAGVFSATGVLTISFPGLLSTTGLLLITCFISNKVLAKIYRLASNTESWLISALILACILPGATTIPRALAVVAAGLIAMGGKYIPVWRGSHVFNPAAAAAFTVSILGLMPVIWWIGSPPMLPFTLLLGLLVLRKTRHFELFVAFALTALVIFALVLMLHGRPLFAGLQTLVLSWPLMFLGTVMLTEPSTMPRGRLNQWLYGALVGGIFSSQLHFGPLNSAPHTALLIGNLFSYLVSPKRGLRLKLKKVTKQGPNIYDFAFALPAGRRLSFVPGQYMEWTLPHNHPDRRGNRRTFSIASSPTESEVHLGTKMYQPSSTFKNALLELQPGGVVQTGHINGDFTLPADPACKLLLIAGGIGITPFRSMLKYLADSNQKRDITLVYAVRDKAEVAFRDILHAAEGLGVRTVILTEQLSPENLSRAAPDFLERVAYISGPDAMVRAVKRQLLGSGVPRRRILTDFFSGY